jgi:hypothetical protein
MSRSVRSLLVSLCFALPAVSFAQEPAPDEKAVGKIKQFLEICLSTPDLNEAGKKVVAAGLVHVSKFDKNDPSKMNPDSLRFAFKKAHAAAGMYQLKVTRVVETGTTGVGFGKTAQKGKLFKYFIAKKEGVNGMPAPVQIFIPEGGGEPVIYDFGSF